MLIKVYGVESQGKARVRNNENPVTSNTICYLHQASSTYMQAPGLKCPVGGDRAGASVWLQVHSNPVHQHPLSPHMALIVPSPSMGHSSHHSIPSSHPDPGLAAFGFTRLSQAGPAPSRPTYRCTSGSNSSLRLATMRPGLGPHAATHSVRWYSTLGLGQHSMTIVAGNDQSNLGAVVLYRLGTDQHE